VDTDFTRQSDESLTPRVSLVMAMAGKSHNKLGFVYRAAISAPFNRPMPADF